MQLLVSAPPVVSGERVSGERKLTSPSEVRRVYSKQLETRHCF